MTMGPGLPAKTATRIFLAGVALLLLGACASLPVETSTDQRVGSAQILSICEKLAKSKDTRLAIGLCEKAHAEDPENPVPLLLLADMLQQQGALASAGRAYGMAIDLDPDNVEAHYGLGKVFLARNQFDLAVEQFEVARELNGRDHRLYNALGVVLDNLGDHAGAQKYYQTGLDLAPNNHALLKNYSLSRRLDDSVATPAIGPRYEVVPDPIPAPDPDSGSGMTPSDAGSDTTPFRQPSPNSPGRHGHEPLAQRSSETKVLERAAAEVSTSRVTNVIGPGEFDLERFITRAVGFNNLPATTRFAPVNSIPANANPPAYYPIVTPQDAAYAEAVSSSVRQEAGNTSLNTLPALEVAMFADALPAQAETARDQIVPESLRTIAAAPEVLNPASASGPRILGTGYGAVRVVQEDLAAETVAPSLQTSPLQPASQQQTAPRQLAALSVEDAPQNAPRIEVIEVGSIEIVPLEANAIEEGFVEAADARMVDAGFETVAQPAAGEVLSAVDSRAAVDETAVPALPVSVVCVPGTDVAKTLSEELPAVRQAGSSHDPVRDLSAKPLPRASNPAAVPAAQLTEASGRGTVMVPAVDVSPFSRAPRRFTREHEDDHETRHFKGDLWDLVDVVNPLQHIPVVASIYRNVTDDEIKPAARIAGGTLFGGILGFAAALADSVVEEINGEDIAGTAIAAVFADQPEYAEYDLSEHQLLAGYEPIAGELHSRKSDR
jgi:Flp pilus assembly protein TadD